MGNQIQGSENPSAKEIIDSPLLRRLSFGSPFQDSAKLFKNIHTFLKSKKKNERLDHSPSDPIHDLVDYRKTDNNIQSNLQLNESPLVLREKQNNNIFHNDFNNPLYDSPTKQINKQTTIFCPEYVSKTDYDIIIEHKLPLHDITNGFSSPHQYGLKKISTSEDISLNHFLKLQINSPHTSPTRSLFNQNNDNINIQKGNNTLHKYPENIKKDKRIIKSHRPNSLRRINSTYSAHKEAGLYSKNLKTQALLRPEESTANLFESKLKGSNIPYYYNQNDNESDNFPRISSTTLNELLYKELYKPHYSSCCIIDCRFEYEYKGGHIYNAWNLSSKDSLEWNLLNETSLTNLNNNNTLLIFHCEFSLYRSPIMAAHLRNCDRILNYENYPFLNYPDILLLDGGYNDFFEKYPLSCFPVNRVAMDSQENLANRDMEMNKFRNESKKVTSRNNSLYRLSSISRSNSRLVSSTVSINSKNDNSFSLGKGKLELNSQNIYMCEPPQKSIFLKEYENSSLENVGNSSPTSKISLYSLKENIKSNSKSIFNYECDDNDSLSRLESGCDRPMNFTSPFIMPPSCSNNTSNTLFKDIILDEGKHRIKSVDNQSTKQ